MSVLPTVGLICLAALSSILTSTCTAAELTVLLRFRPALVSFPNQDHGQGSDFVANLADARFAEESIRDTLTGLSPIMSFRPLAPSFRHLPEPQYDRWHNEIQLADTKDDYSVTLNWPREQETLLRRLQSLPFIDTAELPPVMRNFYDPADAYYPDQWYLNNQGGSYDILGSCASIEDCIADYDINAPEAWDYLLVPGTKLCILDTGARYYHEDLGSSIDYQLSDGENTECEHGTAVLGVAAAAGSNAVGIAGVARPNADSVGAHIVFRRNRLIGEACVPSATVISEVLGQLSHDYYPQILVVSESWGQLAYPNNYSRLLATSHKNAYKKGILIVAASGNSPINCGALPESCMVFPADFNNLALAVTGIDCSGYNANPWVSWTDICAPSDMIVTTDYSGIYAYKGKGAIPAACGTSFSAPMVAAGAAMLLGANHDLTPDDLSAVLRRTSLDLGSPGSDPTYGSGLMRLDAAIELVSDPNAVHFGSATAFSATFIGSRWQRFMNVPCISHESDVWRNRWVRTYELRIWAPFVWDRPGESFVDVWPRRRLSTGYPNDLEIDGNLLTGYLEVLPETITDTGCYLRTYTYKVFSDPSESNCLGWYPLAVPGEGFCLNCTSNARFDYSYIGTTGFARSGAGNARPDSRKGGSMTNVDLIDVGGRVVASLETSPEKFEMALSARVRNLPSGVYFAKIMTPSGPIRGMKIILR